jgi:hypothetical protein
MITHKCELYPKLNRVSHKCDNSSVHSTPLHSTPPASSTSIDLPVASQNRVPGNHSFRGPRHLSTVLCAARHVPLYRGQAPKDRNVGSGRGAPRAGAGSDGKWVQLPTRRAAGGVQLRRLQLRHGQHGGGHGLAPHPPRGPRLLPPPHRTVLRRPPHHRLPL